MSRSDEPTKSNMIGDLRRRLKNGDTSNGQAAAELLGIIPNLSKLNNTSEEVTFQMLIGDKELGPILLDADHLMEQYVNEHPYGKSDQIRATQDREMLENIRKWRRQAREQFSEAKAG